MTPHLSALDWLVVAAYFALMLGVGVRLHRQGGQNIRQFFTGGGAVSWWLIAASLIATSFAADTPLWITGLVRNHGIHAVWQFWSVFVGAGLAVFLFARMWRRSGVMTDMELLELRYSGRGAAFIRGFNASWGALVLNIITIGWVTKAMQTILRESLGLSAEGSVWALVIIVLVTLIYCALSGLLGVIVTDAIQLVVALVGTLALAVLAVKEVGGVSALVAKLQAVPQWPGNSLGISPAIGGTTNTPPGALSVWNFVALLGFAWLGLSYCQGYICQRMLACRDQQTASKAMLGYTLFYWGFLAWPWIVVALCSLILLPPEAMAGRNAEAAYPLMAMLYLPSGLRGLLFVALVAAYMSTVATLINFGASYVVNDIYKRFVVRAAPDRHYLTVSRLMTTVMAIAGSLVAWSSGSVLELLQLSGVFGIGTVLIPALRWFWWRTTPWGEFAAFLTSIVAVVVIVKFKAADSLVAAWLPLSDPRGVTLPFSSSWDYYGLRILAVMIPATIAAVVVSLLTKPAEPSQLRAFIARVQPPAFAWMRTAQRVGLSYQPGEPLTWVLVGWGSMTLCIASAVFGFGWLALGKYWWAAGGLGVCALSLFACIRLSGRH
jgi:Na+/proline symporter